MSEDLTSGIPNPDKPGHWLVPPWPTGATFGEVVLHFLRRHPWRTTSTAHLLAYYEGYRAALDAAAPDEPVHAGDERWREMMRDCVRRCARLFREKRLAEIQPATRTVSMMRTATRETHHMPAYQEIAS